MSIDQNEPTQPPVSPEPPSADVLLMAEHLQAALSEQVQQTPFGPARSDFHDFANTLFKFTGKYLNNDGVLEVPEKGHQAELSVKQMADILVFTLAELELSLTSVVAQVGSQLTTVQRDSCTKLCTDSNEIVKIWNEVYSDDPVEAAGAPDSPGVSA